MTLIDLQILPRLKTIAIAAVGGACFWVLGIPLPLLLGPMLACLAVALAGVRLRSMGALGIFMRTFLGVAVGTSITPQVLHEVPEFLPSLALVPVFVLAIGFVGYPLFRYGFGFNHPTAFYSAMPGGLQDMLVFGEESGGNVRALSLIHATRVLVIVTIAPVVLAHFWNIDLTQPAGAAARSMDPVELALLVFAAFAGWKIAERIGLFGASILGPMILAAAFSLSGIIEHRPPAEIIWAAQFFIGIAVGAKYVGITARELRVFVGAGLIYSLFLGVLSIGFAFLIHAGGLAPAFEASLAFLPGGQAEMGVIAIIAGADLAYVVSHHLLRLTAVILLAPVFAKILQPRLRSR